MYLNLHLGPLTCAFVSTMGSLFLETDILFSIVGAYLMTCDTLTNLQITLFSFLCSWYLWIGSMMIVSTNLHCGPF